MKHTPADAPVNASTYTNHRCRCEGCKTAHAAYIATARARRYAQRIMVEGQWVSVHARTHGSVSTYENWGCRCWACTEAKMRRQS